MTDTFVALSDPTRRTLLDRLSAHGGMTLSQLGEGLPMTRQAVAKHLAVLEAAELVASRRDGRCKRHYLNPLPLRQDGAPLADPVRGRADRRGGGFFGRGGAGVRREHPLAQDRLIHS